MFFARRITSFLIGALLASSFLYSQDLPSIAEKTKNMTRVDGFVSFFQDTAAGKVWLEIDRWDDPFLYVQSQPAGLGSNDIGLDRGQLGSTQVVMFERVGPNVMLVKPNLRYRAETANPAEKRALKDSFAESILWGFEVVASTGTAVLVDATSFVVRDAHGVVQSLQGSRQGTYRFDASRSALHPPMMKGFPKNTELEARVTFTSDSPGRYVRETAADASSFTVRVRHSFIELPGPGYKPRRFDPRSGYFGSSHEDYAVPIADDLTQRYITRHRLQKTDPNAEISDVVEPIVYYLDPGTPEPVRSALLDGARWWAEAFEAAGFRNAYRVEMLPPDADPMDVRYNVIQWVHRSTRGWSYGSSVTDPRTGEIIKGHVSLGSLRVRQDYLIAEGLLAPYEGRNREGMPAGDDPMLEMSLARLRQLSAHEVGHTIGLAHNFAASVNNRASVMDYPAPLAVARGNQIDLSDAYDTGIGEWDIVTIKYGYTQFRPGTDEAAALNAILDDANRRGLRYLTDSDARPAGSAHPEAHLWDNGTEAVQALRDAMRTREVALRRFDENVIRDNEPLALMEEALVPLYLNHRYQAEAAAKLIGGAEYTYALRDDQSPAVIKPVAGSLQREALRELLATIQPGVLALSPSLIAMIPPRPPGYGAHRELFDRNTGLMFDPVSPAATAASMVFGLLLNPQRATRLGYQAAADRGLPGFFEVLDAVDGAVFSGTARDGMENEIQHAVQAVWTDTVLELAGSTSAPQTVRAQATDYLKRLRAKLNDSGRANRSEQAHRGYLYDEIGRFLNRQYDASQSYAELTVPPGMPIGQGETFLQRQERRRAFLTAFDEAFAVCSSRDI